MSWCYHDRAASKLLLPVAAVLSQRLGTLGLSLGGLRCLPHRPDGFQVAWGVAKAAGLPRGGQSPGPAA